MSVNPFKIKMIHQTAISLLETAFIFSTQQNATQIIRKQEHVYFLLLKQSRISINAHQMQI